MDDAERVFACIDYPARHGVDSSLFEAMALPALEQALRAQEGVVIDAIGEMEFSQRFQAMVTRIIAQDELHLHGVICQVKGPFMTSILEGEDVEAVAVSHAIARTSPPGSSCV